LGAVVGSRKPDAMMVKSRGIAMRSFMGMSRRRKREDVARRRQLPMSNERIRLNGHMASNLIVPVQNWKWVKN